MATTIITEAEQGPPGPAGVAGVAGPAGNDGHSPTVAFGTGENADRLVIDGTLSGPHLTGPQGAQGLQGVQGLQGPQGLPGESGAMDEAELLAITSWLNRLQSAMENQGIVVPDSDRITFRTTGSSFAPLLTVTGNPTIAWHWSDNTTSSSATPTKTFTGSANRYQTLQVTPWSALTGINLGYDAGDGGVEWITIHATQAVDLIAGLQNATGLNFIALSHTGITNLDVSGLKNLTHIESYQGSLVRVDLTGCSGLLRACFEQNDLLFVDFSDTPLLQDIRCTGNQLREMRFADQDYEHVWHYCAMDNPLEVPYDMSRFPALQEMWISRSGVAGNSLNASTTALTSAWTSDCQYVSAMLDGCAPGPATASIDLSGNVLTEISIEDAPYITSLDLSNNLLPAAMVDYVLETLDSNGRSNGTLDLRTGNDYPGSSGVTAYNNLVGKGWTVHLAVNQVATPTFSPAAGSYESTQSVTISCSTSGATLYYTTDGSTPTTGSTVYTSAISVAATSTVRALATHSGMQDSEIGSAAYTIGAQEAQLHFTTLGQVMDLACGVSGEATVTWHWADATTTTGTTTSKDFGSSATRQGYLTVDPPTALVIFGSNGNTSARLSALSNLGDFQHLHTLYLYNYNDLATIDATGCTEINQLHLVASGLTSSSYDNLLIALAAQNIPYNNAWGYGDFYAPPCSRTSSSNAAVATLSGLGWPVS